MTIFSSGVFGVDLFGGDSTPVLSLEGRIGWVFYDGVVEYLLPVNPDSASMPTASKVLTQQTTCAGRQIMYEGRPEPKKISFSGVILEEAQYRAFIEWVSLGKQIRVTDDLGQKFWIYLKSFSPKRRRDSTYPWLMDYSADGIVLDRGSVL